MPKTLQIRSLARPHHHVARAGRSACGGFACLHQLFCATQLRFDDWQIIVHGDTREQAMARMRTALSETVVEGINTNIPLHRELMVDAKFMAVAPTSTTWKSGWAT